ncbi:MAG: glycosyltransferase family 4 protein [Candidatus Edwardsbacteria bacterium]|jgi:glycosyltransferase involved in cell wall biosynthesis|nr:glycosyltransferase family 4 protein [Candidatus Edwardsbacteria bacterium]
MTDRRIAINAQLLDPRKSYRGAGVSRYISSLLRAMGRLPDSGLRYHAFVNGLLDVDRCFGRPPSFEWHRSRWPTHDPRGRVLWESLALPVLLGSGRYDLFHSLIHSIPAGVGVPSVVTILDLSRVRFPGNSSLAKRTYLNLMTKRSIARAAGIIAISESSRQDIIELLNADPARVHTVHCGVDPQYRPQTDRALLERVRIKYGLPDQFILYVGTLEPRKNIPLLVRAFSLANRMRLAGVKLVIAGAKGWMYEEIFRVIGQRAVGGEVLLPGYIDEQDMPALYSLARVFAYPSTYEGFGLPVLEAMACGVPVVTTDRSSLPEIGGDAVSYLRGGTAEELRDLLQAACFDTQRADAMRERGLARARQFTWDAAAARTIGLYHSILRTPS